MNLKLFGLLFLYLLFLVFALGWGGLFLACTFLAGCIGVRLFLQINSLSSLNKELRSHPGISLVSLSGSFILPILVYVASEGDLSIFLVMLFAVSPSALMLGYLWFRFLNYIADTVKNRIMKWVGKW